METQATNPTLLNTLASSSLKFDLPKKVSTATPQENKPSSTTSAVNTNVKTTEELVSTSIALKANDEQVLKKSELALNEALFSNLNQKIGFDVDENTGKTIIVIKDKETDEVIRQIPPQHFLDLVYNLNKAASVVLKDIPRYA